MNERIKQLALQAGHRYIPSSNDGTLHVEYLTPELEKFAELLVKECWTTISPFIEDDNLAEDALAELKEHFGVEE